MFARTVSAAISVTANSQINIDDTLSVERSIASHGDLFVEGDIVPDDHRNANIGVGGVLRTDGCSKCAGPDEAVAITAGGNVSAGSLRATGNLTVGGEICVRRHIVSGLGSVSAEGAVLSGDSIQSGGAARSDGEIVHGDGYGVFAETITRSSVVSTECRASPSADMETPVSGAGDVT
jgi:hypothetical protein